MFEKFNKTKIKPNDIKIKEFKNGYEINLNQSKQSIIWLANGNFYIGDFDEAEGKNGKGYEFKP